MDHLYCDVCARVIPTGQEFVSVSVYRERFIADDNAVQPEFAETVWQAHPGCVPDHVAVSLASVQHC